MIPINYKLIINWDHLDNWDHLRRILFSGLSWVVPRLGTDVELKFKNQPAGKRFFEKSVQNSVQPDEGGGKYIGVW